MKNLLYAALGIVVLRAVRGQQFIPSTDGTSYQCPTQPVAEVAAAPYCPPTTVSGSELIGVYSYRLYTEAPVNFRTSSVYDIDLMCFYSSSQNLYCEYYAGGEQGFIQANGSDPDCRPITAPRPQISPGYDYRKKRNGLSKRFMQTPEFNCPWTSDGAPVIERAVITMGTAALNGYSYNYYCYYRQPPSTDSTVCIYLYNDEGGIQPDEWNGAFCPSTLCDTIGPNTLITRRAVFEDNLKLSQRQVNTRKLRQRLQALKGTETATLR